MLKKFSLLILILALAVLLPACAVPTATPAPMAAPATPSSITLTDGLGKTITLAGPAQRVISMAPSNTEMLFAVGAGGQVVGRDSFSDYPAEAGAIADIGGGFGELNLEVILASKPDLVLAADLTPPEQIVALEEVGLTVFSLPNPNNFEDLYTILTYVGTLTGHQPETATLIEGLKGRVAGVEEKLIGVESRPLVFYELDATDPNAPYTSGPGTFIDKVISMAGGENLGASLQGAWVQVSVEELITREPDIILLGDFTWGGVTPEAVALRSGWEGLAAVKNGQMFTFDDNLVSRPGPRLVDGLEAMAKLLHPELFE